MANSPSTNTGGSGGADGVRAGKAFVEVAADNKGLANGLEKARQMVLGFGKFLVGAGLKMVGAGLGILAPIGGLFAAAVNRGDQIKKIAERFGATTEQISELGYAFDTVGVDLNGFADVLKDVSDKVSKAADGQDEAFRRVGLSARELVALPVDEQLFRIAQALQGVQNPADRARVSLELLGGAGVRLVPLLKDGEEGLQKFREEARRVGATVTTEQAEQAAQVADAWGRTTTAIKYAFISVGAALLPQADSIEEIGEIFMDAAKTVREFVEENKLLVLAVVATGAALVALGLTMIVLGTAVQGLAILWGILSTAIAIGTAVIKGSLLGLISPIGLVAVAIAALGALWITQTDSGQAFAAKAKEFFADVADVGKTTWTGLVAAVKKGDLEAAFEVVGKGISAAWRRLMVSLTEAWNSFKRTFVDGWHDFVEGLELGANEIDRFMWEIFGDANQANADADKKRSKIIEGRDRQQKLSTSARDADLALANARFEAKKRELEDLVKQITAKQPEPLKPFIDLGQKPWESPSARLDLSAAVRGAFSAVNYRQVFGIGDTTSKRQLQAAEATAKNTKEIAAAIAGGALVPVFK